MEKEREIKIVGERFQEMSEEEKKRVQEIVSNYLRFLSEAQQKKIEGREYQKTEREKVIIRRINELTSHLVRELGLSPYDIPEENIHIIPADLSSEIIGGSRGMTFQLEQKIFLNGDKLRKNFLEFCNVLLHEMLHCKGYVSVTIKRKENGDYLVTLRRGGNIINSEFLEPSGERVYHMHFSGLEEAVVAEAEKRLMERLFDFPELEEEKRWMTSAKAQEIRKSFSEKYKIPEDDIYWVSEDGSDFKRYSYSSTREVLKYLCKEIREQFSERFKSPDEVFNVFLKSHFTGNLFDIAHLVEGTFGRGSFRILGNMSYGNSILYLETFRKMRNRFKKETRKEK